MRPLRVHYFQHVSFEGPGYTEEWALRNGHDVSATKFYEGQALPSLASIDWLIIMGGPMGVNEKKRYKWLEPEKEFIGKAIRSGKVVAGICLGAQLVAEALGAEVRVNPEKEIGWFPVRVVKTAMALPLLDGLPPDFPAFHWHGDTFGLPADAVRLMESDACENQAFMYGEKVLGLQFHLEATPATLQEMVIHGGSELVPAKWIQTAARILENTALTVQTNQVLHRLLDKLAVLQEVPRQQAGD